VLAKQGYGDMGFKYVTNGLPRYVAEIDFQGRPHKIEVYETGPVMLSGKQLFEAYMPEEFESEEALRESFAMRLDRYLGGGEWEGPDEPGFWESLKLTFKRLFGR
jgi:hypothetical protein